MPKIYKPTTARRRTYGSLDAVVREQPLRYQAPCLSPRQNHKWTLSNYCEHCGVDRVLGKERMAEWRARNSKLRPNEKADLPPQ